MNHGVRDALQDAKGPLYVVTPCATRLDEVATATFRGAPDDLARLGFAAALALDPEAPSSQDFPLAAEIANALKTAKKPLVISGMSCCSEAVMEAAANVAMAAQAALSLTAPECNTVGAALIGGSPLAAAFEAVKKRRADTVIVLENDLYRRPPPKSMLPSLPPSTLLFSITWPIRPPKKQSCNCRPGPSPNPIAHSSAAKGAPRDSSRLLHRSRRCSPAGAG